MRAFFSRAGFRVLGGFLRWRLGMSAFTCEFSVTVLGCLFARLGGFSAWFWLFFRPGRTRQRFFSRFEDAIGELDDVTLVQEPM